MCFITWCLNFIYMCVYHMMFEWECVGDFILLPEWFYMYIPANVKLDLTKTVEIICLVGYTAGWLPCMWGNVWIAIFELIKFTSISFEVVIWWMLQNTFDDKSTLVQVMAGYCHAISNVFSSKDSGYNYHCSYGIDELLHPIFKHGCNYLSMP